MADSKALTIQAGITRQVGDTDALILGTNPVTGSIVTPTGGAADLVLSPDGALVQIGVAGGGKTLDVTDINADPGGGGHVINLGTLAPTGDINISRVGQTTTILGDLVVDGTEIFNGGATFQANATFNGNVTFGDAVTDTVSFVSRVGTVGQQDIIFIEGLAHEISIAADVAGSTTAGGTLTIVGGEGAAAGGGNPGAAGGLTIVRGGPGGDGDATQPAGAGSPVFISGGAAGADGGGGGANGSSVSINGGAASGAGTDGIVSIGITNTSDIQIGPLQLSIEERVGDPGATADRGKVYTKDVSGTTELFYQDSSGNVRQLTPPTATVSPGGVNTNVQYNNAGSFDGNNNFTFDGTDIFLGPATGLSATSTRINIPDNNANGLEVIANSSEIYLNIDTTNANEIITIGNATSDPDVSFAGAGDVRIDGGAQLIFLERVGDPGGAVNEGKVYTKDVSGTTELFYQDSAGNVRQLTPLPAATTPGGANTQVQFNNAGSFDGNANFTFDGTDIFLGPVTGVSTTNVKSNVGDNTADAFQVIADDTDVYLNITTVNGLEQISLGNATTNPDIVAFGSGDFRLDGGSQFVITERVGDPGATANAGKVYTKDVAGTTELFYQDSAGNVRQITPLPAATPAAPFDSVQFNNAGAFGGSADFTFDGTEINLGPATGVSTILTDINIADNTNNAFLIRENINNYIEIDTFTAAESMSFGNGGANTPSMLFTIRAANFSWRVTEAGTSRDYININAGGSNNIELGNITGAPSVDIVGDGGLYLRGDNLNNGSFLDMRERLVDPGNVANRGRLYTKDVSSVTELFYQDSAGNVRQLTPPGGAASSSLATLISQTANEAIAIGAPVVFTDAAGNARSQNADANAAGRTNAVGVAATAGVAAASHDIVVNGQATIPTAIFDVAPGAANVGQTFFLSTTQGQLTLTAPTTSGDTVLRMGKIQEISGGNAICIIQVGDPVVL